MFTGTTAASMPTTSCYKVLCLVERSALQPSTASATNRPTDLCVSPSRQHPMLPRYPQADLGPRSSRGSLRTDGPVMPAGS